MPRPEVRDGRWQLLERQPASEGNGSNDGIVAFAWQSEAGERLLVAVSCTPHRGPCYVRLPFPDLRDRAWHLTDLIDDTQCDREGSDLEARGLYLDEPAWRALAFSFVPGQQVPE